MLIQEGIWCSCQMLLSDPDGGYFAISRHENPHLARQWSLHTNNTVNSTIYRVSVSSYEASAGNSDVRIRDADHL